MDRSDVRMIQRGEDLGLTLKSRKAFLIPRKRIGQNLDRNFALQLRNRARDTLRPIPPLPINDVIS